MKDVPNSFVLLSRCGGDSKVMGFTTAGWANDVNPHPEKAVLKKESFPTPKKKAARWWFQSFFIFTPTWGRFPF